MFRSKTLICAALLTAAAVPANLTAQDARQDEMATRMVLTMPPQDALDRSATLEVRMEGAREAAEQGAQHYLVFGTDLANATILTLRVDDSGAARLRVPAKIHQQLSAFDEAGFRLTAVEVIPGERIRISRSFRMGDVKVAQVDQDNGGASGGGTGAQTGSGGGDTKQEPGTGPADTTEVR